MAVAYAAMPGDSNPKPRRQLIDAWARAPLTVRLDLTSQAMVYPDVTVGAKRRSCSIDDPEPWNHLTIRSDR